MSKELNYDPECENLARYFLSDKARPETVQCLAQHIQNAVEDWITAGVIVKRVNSEEVGQ